MEEDQALIDDALLRDVWTETTNDVFAWLRDVTYFLGVCTQWEKDAKTKWDQPSLADRAKHLSIGWYQFRTILRVALSDSETGGISGWSHRPHEHDIFNTQQCDLLPRDYIVSLAEHVDAQIKLFLPTISQRNGYRFCSVCNQPAICDSHDDVWICDDCGKTFAFEDETALLLFGPTREKARRENIPARMRFDVFARDNFTCRACGRGPRKGDNVKLHVDHIYPVAKGGKTEMSNLQTLCQDCNLGKSDTVVEQMTLALVVTP